MEARSVAKNYRFLAILLGSMVLGAIVGWVSPELANKLRPFGTVFINMMFCVVVPMVFASISSAIANMQSRKRAGKIMGVTILTFVITGAIAAVLMFTILKAFPPVLTAWTEVPAEEIGDYASLSDMIVNFFTASDFVGLLSRRAMLPLIVFSMLFGFATNLAGEAGKIVANFLSSLSDVMMKFVQIITYYAPIAFFAIFAGLVADYGSAIRNHTDVPCSFTTRCALSTSLPHFRCLPGLEAESTALKRCFAILHGLRSSLWERAHP